MASIIPAPPPDASATQRGLVNTGVQQFAGNKTFTALGAFADGLAVAAPTGTTALMVQDSSLLTSVGAKIVGGVLTFDGPISAPGLGGVSFSAVGSSPNANAASVAGNIVTLQPASASFPGLLSAADFTKLSNLSGTNSGDLTLASVGTAPNAAGASISGQVLTLQPASATQPGVMSTTTQTVAGNKTFSGSTTFGSTVNMQGTQLNLTASSSFIAFNGTAATVGQFSSAISAANAGATPGTAAFKFYPQSVLDATDYVFSVGTQNNVASLFNVAYNGLATFSGGLVSRVSGATKSIELKNQAQIVWRNAADNGDARALSYSAGTDLWTLTGTGISSGSFLAGNSTYGSATIDAASTTIGSMSGFFFSSTSTTGSLIFRASITAGSGAVGTYLGLSTADGSVNAGAKLVSFATGLGNGGTVVEKIAILGDGRLLTVSGTLVSGVVNGASAVGYDFNTQNSFSTAGAKLFRFRNNGTELLNFDAVTKTLNVLGTASGAIALKIPTESLIDMGAAGTLVDATTVKQQAYVHDSGLSSEYHAWSVNAPLVSTGSGFYAGGALLFLGSGSNFTEFKSTTGFLVTGAHRLNMNSAVPVRQSLATASANPATGGDEGQNIIVGSTVANGSVAATQVLFSVRTGIGGTEVAKATVFGDGALTQGGEHTVQNHKGRTLDTTDSSTVGSVTVQNRAGKGAVGVGSTSTTLTNADFAADDIVLITPMDINATVSKFKAVAAAGSFTVTVDVAPTGAAWRFSWEVLKANLNEVITEE